MWEGFLNLGPSAAIAKSFWQNQDLNYVFIPKVCENELVMIGGDLNGHVEKDVSGYGVIYEGFVYGVRNLERRKILNIVGYDSM